MNTALQIKATRTYLGLVGLDVRDKLLSNQVLGLPLMQMLVRGVVVGVVEEFEEARSTGTAESEEVDSGAQVK